MSVVITCENQPNRRQLVACQILRFFLSGNDFEIAMHEVEETSGNVTDLAIFGTTSVALPQDFRFFFNEIDSLTFGFCPNLTDLSPLCGMRKLTEIHLLGWTAALRAFPPDICHTTSLNRLTFEELTHFDYSLNLPILQNVEELEFLTGEDLEMAWPEIRGLPNLRRLEIESSRPSLPSLSIGDLSSIEHLELRCERMTDTPWLDVLLRKRNPSLKCLDLRGCYNLSIPEEAILQCSEVGELFIFRCGDGNGDDDGDADPDYQERCSEERQRSHRLLHYVVDLNCSGANDLLCEGNEMLLDDWYNVLSESSIDVLYFFLRRKPDLVNMS